MSGTYLRAADEAEWLEGDAARHMADLAGLLRAAGGERPGVSRSVVSGMLAAVREHRAGLDLLEAYLTTLVG